MIAESFSIYVSVDKKIEEELAEQVKYFKGEDKLIEAQRIAERTNFDIEMMRETGFCSGIENFLRREGGTQNLLN